MTIARIVLACSATAALFLGLGAMASCDRSGDSAAPVTGILPASKTVNLAVTGMTCEGCVAAIEGTLVRMDGVRQCTVDLETGTARVEVDSQITPEIVIEAIQSMAGGQYDASPAGP